MHQRRRHLDRAVGWLLLNGGSGGGGAAGAGVAGAPGGAAGSPQTGCPAGAQRPIAGPLIADFSRGSNGPLPVVESSYRAVVIGNATSDVENAAWHVTGNVVGAGPPVGPGVGAGIVLGCVDTSAYTGVALTIDSSASDCLGASIVAYDAAGGSLRDEFRVVGKMKTTIDVPLVQWNNRGEVSEIDVVPFSPTSSCRFDWTIDDVTFYADPSVAVSTGFQTCPPGLETKISGTPLDFSTASADGFPILAPPYVPFLFGDVTTGVSSGAWHVVGTGPSTSDGLIGAGIVFGCVDPSNINGLSLAIDASGSTCAGARVDFVDWTDTLVHQEDLALGATTTMLQVDATSLGKGQPYAAGLRRVDLLPSGASSCRFEWKIAHVMFR